MKIRFRSSWGVGHGAASLSQAMPLHRRLAILLTRTMTIAAIFAVVLLMTFVTLRVFIHGRTATVPNLAGLSDEEAAAALRKVGLNLSVENRFYSAAMSPNHVLSQSPSAGAVVRRGWGIRVTESLGGQQVPVPDVAGQPEHMASLLLHRSQLEPGNVAHLPAPGPAGVVLATTPAANASGISGPHVGLLLADAESAAPAQAYVMPSLIGQTIASANALLASAGLHIGSASDPSYVAPAAATQDPSSAGLIVGDALPVAAPPPVSSSAVIASQSPAPGHRVTRGEGIRVSISPSVPAPDVFPAVSAPASPQ